MRREPDDAQLLDAFVATKAFEDAANTVPPAHVLGTAGTGRPGALLPQALFYWSALG